MYKRKYGYTAIAASVRSQEVSDDVLGGLGLSKELRCAQAKSVSPLLMRRNNKNLKCLALNITKNNQCKRLNPYQLINEMKLESSKKIMTPTTSVASSNKDLDYIFVKPESKKRDLKETCIDSFLTTQGIFQINLKVVMTDYNIATD